MKKRNSQYHNLLKLLVFFFLLLFWAAVCAAPSVGKTWTVGYMTGSGGLGDESFNDMTYVGLGHAKSKLGCKIVVKEWEQSLSMDKLLKELIQEKADVIVFNGDQFRSLIQRYAPQNDDIVFIANDFDAGSFANVKSIVYSQHEGAFLAGALAGTFSQSKRIGFIGAIDIDVIKAFETGFVEGVHRVSSAARVRVEYISHLPDYSGFNNPQVGQELALELYRQGVDVIFAVAGLSGNGIIQAAKETGKYVIGVDSDQDHMAKGHVLTSVMKRLDIAVFTEIVEAYNGNFTAGTVWYGLDNDGIGLTPMRYTRDILSEQTMGMLQELKRQIISGQLSVTNILATERKKSPWRE